MAPVTQRISYQNMLDLAGASVGASSADTAWPVSWTRDPVLSKAWRTLRGFSVVRGWNDSLDFSEGGDERVALLAAGTYADGAAFAAQVQTAMNAAGASPDAIAGLTGWFRADLVSGISDGGAVTTWADQSGGARDLTQGTAANKPTYKHSVANGRPAISFDGIDDFMDTTALMSAFIGASAGTIFVVYFVPSDASGTQYLLSDTAATPNVQAYVDSTPNFVALNNDGASDTAAKSTTLGAWHVGLWMHDATNINAGNDDADTAALASTASGATSSLANPLRVGRSGSTYLKGYIAEIVVYNAILSEENRRRVEKYLATKYANVDATTAPTWTNTYSATYSSTTYKFTVARSAGGATISLLWSTGKHAASGCGKDLGFVVASDDTGATTYTGDTTSYQGRAWLRADLGAAQSIRTLAALGHNVTSDGTLTVRAFANSSYSGTPGATQVLGYDSAILISYLSAAQNYRYWEFVVDDVQNAAGFVQVGRPWISPYYEPSKGIAHGYGEDYDDMSVPAFADMGASYSDQRPNRRVFRLRFPYVVAAERSAFEAFQRYVGLGRPFLIGLDPQNFPLKTYYSTLAGPLSYEHLEGTPAGSAQAWVVDMTALEVPR